MKEIVKGSIVKFKNPDNDKGGHYRVTCVRGGHVNLGQVFGGKIYFKGVPIADVVEDETAWYEAWTQSDAYRSM